MDSYGGKGGSSTAKFTNTGRAVMQKKFKINDGANNFVEQNTLLEPTNNATALQHDQEEINEVSAQLSQIKKKHDEAKKLVTLKQDEYDRIRKEIIGVEIAASVELTIAETEPGVQGDRVSGARKSATLETGKVVQVPLFVETGDKIRVDTRSGEYMTRV